MKSICSSHGSLSLSLVALFSQLSAPAYADCSRFGCRGGDPYCVYRIFGPHGQKADFRVNNGVFGCWCQVEPGDEFCVTSNGKRPSASCEHRPVQDITPTCHG